MENPKPHGKSYNKWLGDQAKPSHREPVSYTHLDVYKRQLSERASLVHSGTVDPSQDNMLKITSDGRKLGLDQRIVNQMLPDEPGTKVNQCVDCLLYTSRCV